MVTQLALIPLLPLAAFTINIFFGKRLGGKSAWVALAGSVASFVLSVQVIMKIIAGEHFLYEFNWLPFENAHFLTFGFMADPLTAVMLFVVTFIGSLIILYSIGYMHGDARFSRFFAYLSLFMFSMLGLVLSTNLVQIYLFWELVGICSYFLIGFWFEKNSAANASKKAFITNRIGDIGFFIGIAITLYAAGTVSFSQLTHDWFSHHDIPILGIAAVFLFCGAIGKSAQFPLHVWLPDAMEGPTPVSALIHAATMVAAGVYMVARLFPLLMAFPDSAQFVAWTGTITAAIGAFTALTQTDIKKVLAYSTISQLGFMIAALGLGNGGYEAGIFHLTTHAFFKALLFLGAGSVIHGTGTQDIREMGGLYKHMPITATTFLIATIAIAGIPPLAGFWSKDEILAVAYHNHHYAIFGILIAAAACTSFYMFRLLFLTFFGKTRGHFHAHESPAVMTIPLCLLAFFALTAGLPGSFLAHHAFQSFLHGGGHNAEMLEPDFGLMLLSVIVGLLGCVVAFVFYLVNKDLPGKTASALKPIYQASLNKLWFDEMYDAAFVRTFRWISETLFQFDKTIVDGTVNGSGRLTVRISSIKDWIDRNIVDGLVNFVGIATNMASQVLRLFQTGFIHNYLFFVLFGIIVIVSGFIPVSIYIISLAIVIVCYGIFR